MMTPEYSTEGFSFPKDMALSKILEIAIVKTLSDEKFVIQRTARVLGISGRNLDRKIKASNFSDEFFQITAERKRAMGSQGTPFKKKEDEK